MPRRARVVKREVPPDPRFGSRTLTRFMNKLMLNGKKSLAERIVYTALDSIERTARRSPIDVFDTALRNATPLLEVKPRRVGGATYQVPVEIKGDRRQSLAIRTEGDLPEVVIVNVRLAQDLPRHRLQDHQPLEVAPGATLRWRRAVLEHDESDFAPIGRDRDR